VGAVEMTVGSPLRWVSDGTENLGVVEFIGVLAPIVKF
jgi:hypothetical protein